MIQKVRTSLIATKAVNGNNIGDGAVSSNNISANAVTTTAIVNGAITNSKLSEPNAFEDLFLMGGL